MASNAGSRLLELPLELFARIVVALEAPAPLFVPIYGQENETLSNYGNLDTQHTKFYGPEYTEVQQLASQAILSWSSTCSHYRLLLAPQLFSDIVLRTRPKSVASVAALTKTPHWSHVRTLTVCTTFLLDKERDEGQETPFGNLDLPCLEQILSDLPPNLISFTLDLPWDWYDDLDGEDYEPFQIPIDGEFGNIVFTILHTLGQNDISGKPSFTFNVLNLWDAHFLPRKAYSDENSNEDSDEDADKSPDLRRDVTEGDGFRKFLSHATVCKLALPKVDNGVGWQMSVYRSQSDQFTPDLGTLWINNLMNVTSLTIEANSSFPIGSNRQLHPLGKH